MSSSVSHCELLPFVFAFALAAAAAASWESCDAFIRLGLFTRPERRGSPVVLSAPSELSELGPSLSEDSSLLPSLPPLSSSEDVGVSTSQPLMTSRDATLV